MCTKFVNAVQEKNICNSTIAQTESHLQRCMTYGTKKTPITQKKHQLGKFFLFGFPVTTNKTQTIT